MTEPVTFMGTEATKDPNNLDLVDQVSILPSPAPPGVVLWVESEDGEAMMTIPYNKVNEFVEAVLNAKRLVVTVYDDPEPDWWDAFLESHGRGKD